jgi:hypothetical protein
MIEEVNEERSAISLSVQSSQFFRQMTKPTQIRDTSHNSHNHPLSMKNNYMSWHIQSKNDGISIKTGSAQPKDTFNPKFDKVDTLPSHSNQIEPVTSSQIDSSFSGMKLINLERQQRV